MARNNVPIEQCSVYAPTGRPGLLLTILIIRHIASRYIIFEMYNELKSYIVNGIFGKVETKTCAGAKSQ